MDPSNTNLVEHHKRKERTGKKVTGVAGDVTFPGRLKKLGWEPNTIACKISTKGDRAAEKNPENGNKGGPSGREEGPFGGVDSFVI